MLTIAASAAAFFFVQNMDDLLLSNAGQSAEKTATYCSRIRLLTMDADKITVQNNGCGEIKDVIVFIDGQPTMFSLQFPIGEGEIGYILLSNLDIGYYEIKLCLDNGLCDTTNRSIETPSSNFTYNFPINSFAGENSLFVKDNMPNVTYIRLPVNANISSLSLKISTPKYFNKYSLDKMVDYKMMLGASNYSNGLAIFFDEDESLSQINMTGIFYALNEESVTIESAHEIMNITIEGNHGTKILYHNGYVHGVIKTSNSELLYFNYSLSTRATKNFSIPFEGNDISEFIIDNSGNKYIFYLNSTKYLFVSSSKNGGFFNTNVNSSINVGMSVFQEQDESLNAFFYDSKFNKFHMIVTRDYNESENNDNSYRDVAYFSSNDGLSWSSAEIIVGIYKKKIAESPLSSFIINSDSSGNLILIFGEGGFMPLNTYIYIKKQ